MLESEQVSSRSASTLTSAQQAALDALSAGRSYHEAAVAAGVDRMTLYGWTKSDPEFRAAYNLWEWTLRESVRRRLLVAASACVDRINGDVKGDAGFALKVLKAIGVYSGGKPVGTDQRQIERENKGAGGAGEIAPAVDDMSPPTSSSGQAAGRRKRARRLGVRRRFMGRIEQSAIKQQGRRS